MPTRRNGKGLSSQARGLRSQASFFSSLFPFLYLISSSKTCFLPVFSLRASSVIVQQSASFFRFKKPITEAQCLSFLFLLLKKVDSNHSGVQFGVIMFQAVEYLNLIKSTLAYKYLYERRHITLELYIHRALHMCNMCANLIHAVLNSGHLSSISKICSSHISAVR